MPNVPPTLTFTQTYDFAAAHYLWAHDADEKENRSLYGKCSGIHGHNYQVEVVVEPQSNDPVPSDKLDHLVTEHLLEHGTIKFSTSWTTSKMFRPVSNELPKWLPPDLWTPSQPQISSCEKYR